MLSVELPDISLLGKYLLSLLSDGADLPCSSETYYFPRNVLFPAKTFISPIQIQKTAFRNSPVQLLSNEIGKLLTNGAILFQPYETINTIKSLIRWGKYGWNAFITLF